MISGRLERSDLKAPELAFLTTFEIVGRVSVPPGTIIRADLVAQLCERSGPIGSASGAWVRVHFEGLRILDLLDLSDVQLEIGIHFKGCTFEDTDVSADFSRSSLYDLRVTDCVFEGRFRFENSVVKHNLLISSSRFFGAFTLHQTRVGGNAQLLRIEAIGSVEGYGFSLDSSQFSGQLIVADSTFHSGFAARYVECKSTVAFRGSTFSGGARAFALDMGKFAADLTIGPSMSLDGPMSLPGAAIGSTLIVTGVTSSADESSLNLERALVSGAILVAGRNIFESGLRFSAAKCERLEIRETEVINDDISVSADGIVISQDVRLGPGLKIGGEVRFLGADIGGQFTTESGDVPLKLRLNAEGITVVSGLFFETLDPKSELFLADARIGSLILDLSLPPKTGLLRAKYGIVSDVEGRQVNGAEAVALLRRRMGGFSVAPYREMFLWLKSQGDDRGAARVAIAGEHDARRSGPVSRLWGAVLESTVGFGYAPARALVWLGVVVLVASIAFGFLYDGSIVWIPFAKVDSAAAFVNSASGGLFNPVNFAVASLLPGAEWLTSWRAIGIVPEILALFLRLVGWVLATAIVIALATRLQRGASR